MNENNDQSVNEEHDQDSVKAAKNLGVPSSELRCGCDE
jgi:hypothetical protein